MEYRCRLGTISGEVIEGVYVAQSESALRRELEGKGLHVLSLKPRLGLAGLSFGSDRGTIKRHEFLVFNQELATLLKAGMDALEKTGAFSGVLPRSDHTGEDGVTQSELQAYYTPTVGRTAGAAPAESKAGQSPGNATPPGNASARGPR